jgi:hypothetical protein
MKMNLMEVPLLVFIPLIFLLAQWLNMPHKTEIGMDRSENNITGICPAKSNALMLPKIQFDPKAHDKLISLFTSVLYYTQSILI